MTSSEGSQRISVNVIETIAEECGTDPIDLPPLYDVVDPDALDTLFRDPDITGSVSFTYVDHRVSVDPRGEVTIEGSHAERSPVTEY